MNRQLKSSIQSKSSSNIMNTSQPRKFDESDIPKFLDKIFSECDTDGNRVFNKAEFRKVVDSLINIVGGECPNIEDVSDLFNLLDINGDETIDKKELSSLLVVFFKLLKEKEI